MSQGFGRAFDAAQRAYDNRSPQPELPWVVCERCGDEYDGGEHWHDGKRRKWCPQCIVEMTPKPTEQDQADEK